MGKSEWSFGEGDCEDWGLNVPIDELGVRPITVLMSRPLPGGPLPGPLPGSAGKSSLCIVNSEDWLLNELGVVAPG